MGIYDREYYRGETRGSGWITGTTPVCNAIIVINIAMFFLAGLDPRLFNDLKASSREIFYHGHVWQLLTATFLHADTKHILWNMVFFWMIGRELEPLYGSRDFLVLYLSSAIISTLGWAAIDIYSSGPNLPMVGASGAVMAVVVIYALYYPHREILLFFIVPVEMWLLVLIYVASDAFELLRGGSFTQVAVAAHLSGAAYGYAFKQFDLRWSRLSWRRVRGPRFRVIMPEPREKATGRTSGPTWSPNPPTSAKPSTTAVLPEEQLDAKLDEVLAKIAREGRSGLTEEENRVLQEASRRARNRRSDRI